MILVGVVDFILEEGILRSPKHQRRMKLLKARKTGTHLDFLMSLESFISVEIWETMLPDEFAIHLCTEFADTEMAEIDLEILSSKHSTVQERRMREAQTESA